MTLPLPSSEGYIAFLFAQETHQLYYALYGDLGARSRRPLVILHGGPGVPHDYCLSFTDLSTLYGVPVLFFDQIGAGKSTHLPEKTGEFWTMDIFQDQIDVVLRHFDIYDDFDLLGQSWGGMLAAWYAGERRPRGLKHLILANCPARDDDWVDSSLRLMERADFPKEYKDIINNHELGIVTNEEGYNKASEFFLQRHCCRVLPWPKEVTRAFESNEKEPSQANAMLGPFVIRCTGTLKGWNVTHLLPQIEAPTLLLNGEYDQAQDKVVEPFLQLIPKVKWVKFYESSHMPHYEEREKCMLEVKGFLDV